MRGPEPVIPKPEKVRRILILGDSFAFGQGVAQEEALPFLLRVSLTKDGIDPLVDTHLNALGRELLAAGIESSLRLMGWLSGPGKLESPGERAEVESPNLEIHR